MEESLDIAKLKYVLYARKSSDNPERQIRSTSDQIDECRSLALRLGIEIVDIFREAKFTNKSRKSRYFSNFKKYCFGFNSDFIISLQLDSASDTRFKIPLSLNKGSTILDLQNIRAS